jgi:hypothetical protein
MFVLFVIWLGMLWPNRQAEAARRAPGRPAPPWPSRARPAARRGRQGWRRLDALTSLELNSLYIWIPPFVFAVGAGFVPGGLGTFVRATIGLLASLGQAIGSGLA